MSAAKKWLVLVLSVGVFAVLPASSASAAIPDIDDVLAGLATSAASSGLEAGLGTILSQYGLGNATAGQIQQIHATLEKIQTRLAELKAGQSDLAARIEASTYKLSLVRTNSITAKLLDAEKELRAIAAIPEADVERRRLRTNALLHEIRTTDIWSALSELDNDLKGVAGKTGLIAASSGVERATKRFFRHQQSVDARTVWRYFQYFEAIALQLGLEYRKAHPAQYTKADNETYVADERLRLAHQKALLKPLVPTGLAIDTTTGLGWDFQTMNTLGPWYAKFTQNKIAMIDNDLRIGRYLYARVPSESDLASMLKGYTGDPVTWLHKEAGGPATMTRNDLGYNVWTSGSFQQKRCSDIFNYFNCTNINYAVSFVVKQSCSTDPDGTTCGPGAGQGQAIELGHGYKAGTIQMVFEPQNTWYYAAPPASAGTTRAVT